MATKDPGKWSEDFSIRQFYQQVLNAGGFARDMQLRVTNFTVNGINSLALTDLIFLRTAQLPGKKINTIELAHMGVDLQIPSTVSYDPNPLSPLITKTIDSCVNKSEFLLKSSSMLLYI